MVKVMVTTKNIIDAGVKAVSEQFTLCSYDMAVQSIIVWCSEGTIIPSTYGSYRVTRNNRIRFSYKNGKTHTEYYLSEVGRGKQKGTDLLAEMMGVAYKAMIFEDYRSLHQPNRPFKIGAKVHVTGEDSNVF